ncbi:competence/damage-inducible protein A [Aciduricibacillus chroicocephali]|uniref:Putative competence-damage inducible protein n=1 Tax=Aciduricibacillus chroicocephali TaxID=3054939 RepID=A0ABY9KY97_9BACI|nr:competence/damage-inducible protein A [Bacillaceae bacterium 44XB]
MIKREKAEIIAVGTELLLGQITNTNASWLSERLAELGLNVFYHSVVGDNLHRVCETFAHAHERSDLVIVTGGLGPTDDDLTREAFSEMSSLKMFHHEPTMVKLEDFFRKQKSIMTENNKKQALVFETAEVLDNSEGTAPGLIVEYEGTTWVFLPGVPREMKSLAEEHVFSYLERTGGRDELIRSLVLRFSGVGESKLETELKDLITEQSNPTVAPLVAKDGVTIRITAKAETAAEADELNEKMKSKVLSRVGQYFYGMNDETLASTILSMLKEKKLTIASAESLTGGMFADELISIPGASSVCLGGVVSYARSAKERLLGVPKELIDEHGTVSEACATAMAKNVKELLGGDIGISFTGVAGPGSAEGKPAGTVFIGLATSDEVHAHQFSLHGGRHSIRSQSVNKGLELIYKLLKS